MRKALTSLVLAAFMITTVSVMAQTEEGQRRQGRRREPVTPEKKIDLWTKDSMDGWRFTLKNNEGDPKDVWSIKDGVVTCKGAPLGYMRTRTPYKDYQMHLEWRWTTKGGNSGVLLHATGRSVCSDEQLFPKCVEAQLKSQRAGDVVIMYEADVKEKPGPYKEGNPFIAIPRKKDSNEKPIGEWNTYDIICKGDTVTLYVNGLLQNKVTQANPAAGTICLQSEGEEIQFRNAYLSPLKASDHDHSEGDQDHSHEGDQSHTH